MKTRNQKLSTLVQKMNLEGRTTEEFEAVPLSVAHEVRGGNVREASNSAACNSSSCNTAC